jgi:carboxypeptidase Taq
MASANELYHTYCQKMQRIADIRFANAVLQWDQETYLPAKGGHFRGQQISTLSELAHQQFSEEALGNLLKELLSKGELGVEERRNAELTLIDFNRNKKYTSEFVRKLSDATNKAFHAWLQARKQNDFAFYRHALLVLVQLKREEAERLGYEEHPYNALLDEFERGATVQLMDTLFSGLLPSLKDLLNTIGTCPQADNSFLEQSFPKEEQWKWGMYLVKELGFDFEGGRQDISEHPFSISFNRNDVRITTRIDETHFGNMTWSCIHETGHALYEQGLPEAQYGLPLGEACSYSIHESQSRLWENHVGRGLPFWKHFYPSLQMYFPLQFSQLPLDAFYKGINKVQPSLIRTEADEITYHFHVFIRYELEKKLIEGSLEAADIPAYWKEQYQKWLGVTVPDDKRGALQDVHWSHGSFGYFPTYSMGSFYAAQLYAKAREEMPSLENDISLGDTSLLLQWLRQKVHIKGRFYSSEELCREVTGKTLNVSFFLDYLLQKYRTIYNLS